MKASSPITQVAPLATSRLTAAIAVTVLTGWIAQIDLLKNFAPGMIAMNPFTAGGLLAASIALFLRQPVDAPKERSIIGQLLAGTIIAMGGLNLLLCSHNLVGPRWLILPPLADGSLVEVNGARISLSFVLIGASILSLNWKSSRGFRPAEAASAVTTIIAILSLVSFDLDFLLLSRNRHSPGAGRPRNIGNHRQRDRGWYAGSAAHSAGDSSSHIDRCTSPNR
ncbi:MAG: hypothetical protein DMC57_00935 [Verrucomicrobia bacterium]|nr:MAG: hypothetical protein DMC57_00935 [Verrucomicrobiota bacterium]